MSINFCFFCDSKEIVLARGKRKIYWNYKTYSFLRCKDCRGFSMHPILDHIDISKLYDASYVSNVCNQNKEIPQLILGNDRMTWWKYSLRYLESQPGSTLKVLDFGCGTNSPFLNLAKELGHSVSGVEYDYQVCKLAEANMGLRVYSLVEFLQSSESFDLIFLGDVLEHLSPPNVVLELLKKRMNKGGKLVVQGPLEGGYSTTNFGLALVARIRKGHTVQPPFHVSLATKHSLMALLDNQGLKLDFFKVNHVFWPAPDPKQLLRNFSFRGLLLCGAQLLDSILCRFFKDYGNRFTLVASIN